MRRLLLILLSALAFSATADPFRPGSTSNVVVTGTAQTLTLPTPYPVQGTLYQYVFNNVGTQTVFFLCDGFASTAPTTVTSSNGMPVGAGVAIVISYLSTINACSVIAATTGSTLYVTMGAGQ
jgi:hypothetical protein